MLDSLIKLRNPLTVVDESRGFRMILKVGFSPADGFVVARDGAVAAVRAEPYRVEWRVRNGTLVKGPVYAFGPLPITDADREALAEARRSVELPGNLRISRPDGTPIDPSLALPEGRFAAAKPTFLPNEIRIDPQDRVWVRRHTVLGAPLVYDVFDRRGTRVDRVQLPPRTTLAGSVPRRSTSRARTRMICSGSGACRGECPGLPVAGASRWPHARAAAITARSSVVPRGRGHRPSEPRLLPQPRAH